MTWGAVVTEQYEVIEPDHGGASLRRAGSHTRCWSVSRQRRKNQRTEMFFEFKSWRAWRVTRANAFTDGDAMRPTDSVSIGDAYRIYR